MIISTIVKAYAKAQEYNDEIVELRQKLADLQTSKSNLLDTYNLNTKNATAATKDTVNSLQSSIGDVTTSRDLSLRQGAKNVVQQQALLAEQTAELQVQASEAQGSAIQTTALSGFRNSGSATNATQKSDLTYSRAIVKSEAQRKLSLNQSYDSAFSNYTNANMQIKGYERQIQYAKNDLERTLSSYNLQYEQNKKSLETQIGRVEDDLEYAEGEGQVITKATIITGIFNDMFSDFAKAFAIFG